MDIRPPSPPPPADSRARSCLWLSTTGCLCLVVFLALLIAILVWLVKFVWALRIDQWF